MGVALADGTDATSNSRIVVISHSGGGGGDGGGGGVDQKLLLYPEVGWRGMGRRGHASTVCGVCRPSPHSAHLLSLLMETAYCNICAH